MNINSVLPKKYPQTLVLASISNGRQRLLRTIGFDLVIISPNIDEIRKLNESPADLVSRLAREKVMTVSAELNLPIIAADTIVFTNNQIFGKPDCALHARKMIAQLSNNTHEVFTGYSVKFGEKIISGVSRTKIVFRKILHYEIEMYMQSNKWKNKSGACDIEGQCREFIVSVTGCFSGVIGLPLMHILNILDKFG